LILSTQIKCQAWTGGVTNLGILAIVHS